MGTFLEILGLIFLVGIVFVLGLVVFLWLKVRAVFRGIKATIESLPQMAAAMAPARIHLAAIEAPDWDDEERVQQLAEPLAGLDFQPVGSFAVEEVPGLCLQAWVKPEQSITAVIYEHPKAGTWLDFFTHYQDGTRITYANSKTGGGVDHAPGHTVERFPDQDTRALYDAFLAARPDRPARSITADTFVSVYESTYADEMDWRNSRGGPTEDEIRAVAALSGTTLSPAEATATRLAMQEQALGQLEVALRERYLEQAQLSPTAWEEIRERLVFVHDQLTPDRLDSAVEAWTGDDDTLPSESLDGTVRRTFSAFNDRRPEQLRFRKLGELKEPIETDIYRAPEA